MKQVDRTLIVQIAGQEQYLAAAKDKKPIIYLQATFNAYCLQNDNTEDVEFMFIDDPASGRNIGKTAFTFDRKDAIVLAKTILAYFEK